MIYIYAAIIGYLLGTVNPAYLFGRMKGIDIRTVGSGNAGASNAKVVLGWKYFFMTAVYDVVKCAVAMGIAQYVLKGDATVTVAAGAAAIIGHCYPFYMGFRGGKGFASLIGLAAYINFPAALIVLLISIAAAFATNYIVTATMTFVIGVPIYLWFFMDTTMSVRVIMTLVSIMMTWRHRMNFARLLKGEEIGINGKSVGFGAKKKNTEE